MTIEKNTVFYNLKKLGKLKFPNISSVLKQYQIIHKSMIKLKYINYEIFLKIILYLFIILIIGNRKNI